MNKNDYKENTLNWWECDNIVHPKHEDMAGLLHMGFPRVFILMRDYSIAYFTTFERWKSEIVEINFFDKKDRESANIDELLVNAWNFLVLQEREEDKRLEEYDL